MEVGEIAENKIATNDKAPERVIKESTTEIIAGGAVFYNPVQEFNRDLSISVLNVYSKRLIREREAATHKNAQNTNESNANDKKPYTAGVKYDDGLRILGALFATGLCSIRYAKEVAGVREIVANDLSKVAVDSISVNMLHNGVEHLIVPSEGYAMTLMYLSTSYEKRFDVIDLDPYGSLNRFLDGAIQSLTSGGLLLVTATDMAVLAGNTPLRMKCCHEMGLRILLHCIETHANRYGKYIEPLLSISADVYIRVFVCVHRTQAKCKYSMSKQSMIFQCTGCDTYTLQPMGIVKSKISDKDNAEVKCGIYAATIGLQRENCEDQSNNSLGGDDVSSHISFQSTQKGSETSATTSCYETAHDTAGASAPRKVSHYTQSESSEESHELEKSIILINLDNTLEPPASEHATVTELITNDNKMGNLSPTVNETQMLVKPLQECEKTFTYSPKKAKSNCGSPAKKFINGKPTAVVTGTKIQFTY
ncbi:tRNA (guanine(26)-N(2))-dimethyltransferase-like isoform X2 [Eurosta solidaginis]|uniref:tRNA (guanine(26)-N(2))-dimethyltransferase-like isoform X2 n=1 Tax=Eurosta solidaginis TaxID=178769 RepID=UPI0035309D55